jgi:SAM-dependent methyltransferase
MGLNSDTIRIVARLLRDRPTTGRAITFGVQRVGGSYADLAKLLTDEGYPVQPLDSSEIVTDPLDPRRERLHQNTLFRMLGYRTVHSIDIRPDEKPTYQLDLNQPVPAELCGNYDLVCDSGTTEHCFNVPQVLTNVVRLLRPGGTVLQVAPITGWLTHGFYQFCPGLFFHFYAHNGFTDLEARIEYEGRCLDAAEYVPRRDFLGRKALLIFVGRKPAGGDPEADAPVRWPIQSQYETEEVERVVKGLGGRRPPSPGRRSVWSPSAWARDAGAILKQYLRLAWRARLL